jgi:DNA processing protein
VLDQLTILNSADSRYPSSFHHVPKPPTTLYVRGNVDLLQHPNLLAVVGSRRPNYYGRQVIEKIVKPAVQAGLLIVSGFARGIDTLAHQVALAHHQPTLAILGSGVSDEAVYPKANHPLIQKILSGGGALLSEYPPSTKAQFYHFPARNRLIAGLCPATLVIQATHKSGSLITARLALDQGQDVCAIPGPITDPLSSGPNHLLQAGAHLITSADDLLALYSLTPPAPAAANFSLTLDQGHLFKYLTHEPQHIDAIIATSSLPAAQVSVLLLELELAGAVTNLGGLRYVRK